MSYFDNETRFEKVGETSWQGEVDSHWNIGDNPNGGYLLSIVARAISEAFPAHPQPISVTTHYLRPGLSGQQAIVEVDIIRKGRTTCSASATLVQDGKPRLTMMAVFGLAGEGELTSPPLLINPPEIPLPDDCPQRSGEDQGVELPIASRLDTRLHPMQSRAGKNDTSRLSGWIRFVDQRPVDYLSCLLFCDAFPPSVFALLGNIGWVPTVELTVHIRRKPVPGWILGEFYCEDLQDGRIIENGALWDQEGNLVAQSRQLALLLS